MVVFWPRIFIFEGFMREKEGGRGFRGGRVTQQLIEIGTCFKTQKGLFWFEKLFEV